MGNITAQRIWDFAMGDMEKSFCEHFKAAQLIVEEYKHFVPVDEAFAPIAKALVDLHTEWRVERDGFPRTSGIYDLEVDYDYVGSLNEAELCESWNSMSRALASTKTVVEAAGQHSGQRKP